MNAPTAFPDQQSPFRPTSTRRCFRWAGHHALQEDHAEGVRVEKVLGKDMLVVSREALRALSEAAFGDINHYLRPGI
jgi:fumarate hydratase class I